MKKIFYLTLCLISILTTSSCSIDYSKYEIKNPGETDTEKDTDTDTGTDDKKDTDTDDEKDSETDSIEFIDESLVIDEGLLSYPSSISQTLIDKYSKLSDTIQSQYRIYSTYYSAKLDTLYIAYDYSDPTKYTQTLDAKDLYEIEKHALMYFTSDSNKSEYVNYLKAVRIFPDALSSSCGATDESSVIKGCANYGGKEATIDLNYLNSLDNFYNSNPKYISLTQYFELGYMRSTFAHEYGHISTFYHMIYKNDENYEDYLKLRLKDTYNTIYPTGLPDNYSSSSNYSIQPEEILADDYVELFYRTNTKNEKDSATYNFNYSFSRGSLSKTKYHLLENSPQLLNELKEYYETNFLNYKNKQAYKSPIVIETNNKTIEYYESYSKLNTANTKTIASLIDVKLIAVGHVIINNVKYYRIILSNTMVCPNFSCDRKDVGEKLGYVKATDYNTNDEIQVYKLNLSDNSILPISASNENSIYLVPNYDFSYAINISKNKSYITMYDYLNSNISSQTYTTSYSNFISI